MRRLASLCLALALLLPAAAHAAAQHLGHALRQEWRLTQAAFPAPGNPYLIVVGIRRQALYLLVDGKPAAAWPVSTGLAGTGNLQGSLRTPLGMFEIVRKFGAGLPAFAALSRLGPTGGTATPVFAADDPAASRTITTRILALQGLQPGWNQGGEVDTLSRHIYIHGTANLGMLGQPASHGCIQMAPGAVIALFRRVPIGTRVLFTRHVASPNIPGPHAPIPQLRYAAQTPTSPGPHA